MTKNSKILINLQRVLTYKFVFFLPFDLLHIENVRGLLHYSGITVTQDFIDKYVDILLIFDFDLQIHEVQFDPSFNADNQEKTYYLQENCRKLAELKDTSEKTSFRSIFNKYVEQIVVLNYVSDILVELYYKYFYDEIDMTYIFRQQKLVLLTHLVDIEKTFLKKGKSIDSDSILQDILKPFFALPPVNIEIGLSAETSTKEEKEEEDLINLVKTEVTTSEGKNTDLTNGKKYLRDFIIHGDKIKIEEIIVSRFKNRSAITIKYLIESLQELGYIVLIHGDLKIFIQALSNSFNNGQQLNYQSVTSPKVKRASDKNYKLIKLEIIKALGH